MRRKMCKIHIIYPVSIISSKIRIPEISFPGIRISPIKALCVAT